MVRERPILFSGEMVRAILEGRKTQTRRVVTTPLPDGPEWCPYNESGWAVARINEYGAKVCTCQPLRPSYGYTGDRLWVREGFIRHISIPQLVGYVADGCAVTEEWERRAPSIHMPRRFCRIVLELTNVRVERLSEISDDDAKAEAPPMEYKSDGCHIAVFDHRKAFALLWDSLNAARGYGWDVNPWVWALTFRRVEA